MTPSVVFNDAIRGFLLDWDVKALARYAANYGPIQGTSLEIWETNRKPLMTLLKTCWFDYALRTQTQTRTRNGLSWRNNDFALESSNWPTIMRLTGGWKAFPQMRRHATRSVGKQPVATWSDSTTNPVCARLIHGRTRITAISVNRPSQCSFFRTVTRLQLQ